MASVVYHAYNQIKATGKMKLFKSHHPDFKDGEQQRDFVYVNDLSEIMTFLMTQRPSSGLYNIGSGVARTFLDLVSQTFVSMGLKPQIEFVDTPIDIRDKYQYFTQAEMSKLQSVGYSKPMYDLETGVDDYVTNYLLTQSYF
jgi:ADP-L-glycero-D-manno-heptose 6-epimerase